MSGVTAQNGEAVSGDILERDPALDGVRGIAIGVILLGHAFTPIASGTLRTFLHHAMDSLSIGVDLFFVLSGFLITSILIRTRESPGYFRNFYARRALRIFPAYYLVLAGVLLVRPLFGTPQWQAELNEAAPYFLLYIQNLVMAWRGEGLGWVGVYHTWSLAIEEQFYWVWPIVVLLVPKARLLRVCLIVCAGSVLVKVVGYAADLSWWAVYMNTLSRCEGLAGGAALAAWLTQHQPNHVPVWLRVGGILAGVALVLEVIARGLQLVAYELHCVLLILAAVPFFAWLLAELVVGSAPARLRRGLQAATLRWLGRYSYGLYLIHAVVLWDLRAAYLPEWQQTLGGNWGIAVSGIIGIAISVALAVAMFHLVERPALRLKRHFAPERPRTISAAAARP